MKLLSLIVSLSAVSEAFQVRHGGVRAPQKKVSPVEMSLRSEIKKMSGYPSRVGKCFLTDLAVVDEFVKFLRERASTVRADDYVQPIKDLQSLVEQNPNLLAQFDLAFETGAKKQAETINANPDRIERTPTVKSFDEFVSLLNAVMLTAPEYSSLYNVSDLNMDDPAGKVAFQDDPAGVVAFPVNALLAWPMSTSVGQDLFANVLVNDCFLRILNYWQETFLTAEGSRYVFPATAKPATTRPDKAVGWLSDDAKKHMVLVAFAFAGKNTDVVIEDQTFVCKEAGTGLRPTFEEVFDLPNPKDKEYAGFSSWDNFFLRKFSLMGNKVGHGPRPLNGLRGYQPWPQSSAEDDSVIVNACESAPLTLDRDVSAESRFWLKEQKYSLSDMLNKDELAHNFYGGCVYQGYLSALSYHRWNAPVSGTVVKVDFIPGAYFLESMHTGFDDFENDSQMFLTATATRMAIYIQAKDPNIGLMVVLAIGMGEVSSCEAVVKAGQVLQKGDEIGKFHYGGSSHCLIFTKEAAEKLDFFTELKTPNGEDWYNTKPGLSASNVPVLAQIAKYNPDRVTE